MNSSHRRRFIAGAVCPRCGAMDKIVWDMEADRRECVACEFQEARPQAESVSELKTRVNRPSARLVETPAQPVRLMEPTTAATDGDD